MPPRAPEALVPEGQLRDVVGQLVRLHAVSTEMAQASCELDIIRVGVAGALRHLGVDRLGVFLIEGKEVLGTYGTDDRGEVVCETDFRGSIPEHPMVQRALQRRHHVAVEEDVPLYLGNRIVGRGWNAMIALWDGNEALGWIACDNLFSGHPFDPFQKEVLKLFGSALAQAIVRERGAQDLLQLNEELRTLNDELETLNEELEVRVEERTRSLGRANEALEAANLELRRLSHLDGLTGIANRRLFDVAFEKEWARGRRAATPLSVVLVDVDFFKQYNDCCGHLRGDEALRRVAEGLEASVRRGGDLVARYGGEEFVLLLPQTPLEGALAVAEAAREAIADLELTHPASPFEGRMTISLGVACCVPHRRGKRDALVEAADRALYEAKKQGRNRVCVAESTEEP